MRPRTILITCAFASLGIAVYALFAPSGAPRLRRQSGELETIERDVATLKSENESLRADAQRLSGDDPKDRPFLEQAVRAELGYVRPDEQVVLTNARSASDSGRPSPEAQP